MLFSRPAAWAIAALMLLTSAACAELQFDAGRWRLELSGYSGLHAGSTDRSGDTLIIGNVDYEFPASPRCTLSLRLMPLFAYDQDDPEPGSSYDGSNVWGGGLGLVGRIYSVPDEYRGWFGEAQIAAVGHNRKIDGNSSHFNFLSGLGAGYQFQNHWHVTVQVVHISNASIGSENAGANAFGLGLGYSF